MTIGASNPRRVIFAHRENKGSSRMKRSHEVMLWMLGAGLGVAILSEDKTVEQLKQDRYASKEDCLKDWGGEESCKEEWPQGGSHASGGSGGGGGGGGNGDNRYR